MVVIALTGGIASGKSTVATMLQELGAHYIDADDVARRVVEPGSEALNEITQTFGESLIRDGQLDRVAMGALVFSDPDSRARLNAIVHPRVRQLTSRLIEEARQQDPEGIVVYAVPLLVEAESAQSFDLIVVVSASPEVRIQRLIQHRGMSLEQARARIAAQATEEERLSIADVVIDTNGSLSETRQQVEALWHQLHDGHPA